MGIDIKQIRKDIIVHEIYNISEITGKTLSIEQKRENEIAQASLEIQELVNKAISRIVNRGITFPKPFMINMSLNIQVIPKPNSAFALSVRILPDPNEVNIFDREDFLRHFNNILRRDLDELTTKS